MKVTFSRAYRSGGRYRSLLRINGTVTCLEIWRWPEARFKQQWHIEAGGLYAWNYIGGPLELDVAREKATAIAEAAGDAATLATLCHATEPPSWWPW